MLTNDSKRARHLGQRFGKCFGCVEFIHSPTTEHSRPEELPYCDQLKAQFSARQYESPNPRLSTQRISQEEQQGHRSSSLGLTKPLERHCLGVWLILLYAIAASFSWIVTCILSDRPIGIFLEGAPRPTYYDQSAHIGRAYYQYSNRWMQAAKVISAVLGAVGIPVTSATCATATAVYCQRNSDSSPPSLTLRQTLALADKGWSDFGVIRNMIWPSKSGKTRSGLLPLSTGLVGLGESCCFPLGNVCRLTFPEQPLFYLYYRVLWSKPSTSKYRPLKTITKY